MGSRGAQWEKVVDVRGPHDPYRVKDKTRRPCRDSRLREHISGHSIDAAPFLARLLGKVHPSLPLLNLRGRGLDGLLVSFAHGSARLISAVPNCYLGLPGPADESELSHHGMPTIGIPMHSPRARPKFIHNKTDISGAPQFLLNPGESILPLSSSRGPHPCNQDTDNIPPRLYPDRPVCRERSISTS